MLRNLIVLIAGILVLTHCTEVVKPTEEEIGRDYFPLAVGNYWIYNVTETRFSNQLETKPGDSVKYQVRERVSEIYQDQTGQAVYKVIRSRRENETKAWTSDSIVLVNKSSSSVQVSSNDLKTINLIFPVVNNKRWNGNAFNTRGPEEFVFQESGAAFPFQDTTYSNTVKVIQLTNKNAIESDDRHEVYASGVGLIYKYAQGFDYCNDPASQGNCQVGQDFIVSGIRRVWKLSQYKIVK